MDDVTSTEIESVVDHYVYDEIKIAVDPELRLQVHAEIENMVEDVVSDPIDDRLWFIVADVLASLGKGGGK